MVMHRTLENISSWILMGAVAKTLSKRAQAKRDHWHSCRVQYRHIKRGQKRHGWLHLIKIIN